jgi:glycerophosphoryl diester phosphodiesterase
MDAKPFIEALDPPVIVAHRGASAEFPGNTMEAFTRALEVGPDVMLELDIWPTRDGEIVVFHDDLLELATDGFGRIPDYHLDDILRLDAGYNFTQDGGQTLPFRGKGTRILRFHEFLKAFPESLFSVDLKFNNRAFAEKAMELMKSHRALERVVVGSFIDPMTAYVRRNWPGVATSFGKREIINFLGLHLLGMAGLGRWKGDLLMVPEFTDTSRPEYLGPGQRQGMRVVTRRFVTRAHSLGIPVMVWTVNRPENMKRLLEMGVQGIVTDDPALCKEIINTTVIIP